MIVSGEPQRDSAIHVHVSLLPQTPLPSRLPHNTEQSSLCYTVRTFLNFNRDFIQTFYFGMENSWETGHGKHSSLCSAKQTSLTNESSLSLAKTWAESRSALLNHKSLGNYSCFQKLEFACQMKLIWIPWIYFGI